MNTKTKLTALLMSILMVVAMIPAFAVTVSAAGNEASLSINGAAPVEYATFEEAWAEFEKQAKNTPCEIKLLADCVVTKGTTAWGAAWGNFIVGTSNSKPMTLTLDLNGYALIKDSTTPDGAFICVCYNGSQLTVKDSRPDAPHKYRTGDNGLLVLDEENGDITINGGVITGGVGKTSNSGKQPGAIQVASGKLIVEGGNFIGNTTTDETVGSVIHGYNYNGYGSSTVVISGGKFVGNAPASVSCITLGTYDAANSSITGGTFSNDLSEVANVKTTISADYKIELDSTTGWYNVKPLHSAVCSVNGVDYYSFADAIKNANADSGSTLKLLADCQTTQGANWYGENVKGNVTIDLNGFVLSPEAAHRVLYVTKDAVVTIIDSNPTAEHWYYESTETPGLYVLDDEGGDNGSNFMIPGGVITGGVALKDYMPQGTYLSPTTSGGGAITVRGGTLIINGGNIIGNKGNYSGAFHYDQMSGVGASIVINGGKILGNAATDNSGRLAWGNHIGSCNGVATAITPAVNGGTFSENVSVTGGLTSYMGVNNVAANTTLINGKTVYDVISASVKFVGAQQSIDKTQLRLIAMVKESAIVAGSTFAGFEVSKDGRAAVDLASNYYYTKLLAQEDGETAMTEITPAEGYVLIAVVITGIPTDQDITFTVTPTLSTMAEGELVNSATVEIKSAVAAVAWAN